MQRTPEPNPEPDTGSVAPEDFHDAPNVPPNPNNADTAFFFLYDGQEIELSKEDAIPSSIVTLLDIPIEQLQLQRRDKVFIVDVAKDKFRPTLKPGRKYTVVKNVAPNAPPRSTRQTTATGALNDQECTIIVNHERKQFASGSVPKNKVAKLAPQNVQNVRLIDQGGSILNHTPLNLIAGATYYLIYNNQNVLSNGETQQEDTNAGPEMSLCRPMSFMAPFIIGVVRIFYALSQTGNEIKLTHGNPEQKDSGSSKLVNPSHLSTGAYQVAFLLNEAAKVIQSTVSRISSKAYKRSLPSMELEDFDGSEAGDDETPDFFEEVNKSDSPLADVASVVQHLQKSLVAIDELSTVVIKKMQSVDPTVESVKVALKAQKNQEKRRKQHEKMGTKVSFISKFNLLMFWNEI